MREIKFRTWDYDTNTMVYPDSELETIFCFDKVGLSVYHSNGKELGSFEVNQYTGLKDKNGKEVYEGDIIQFVWSEDSCWGEAGTYKGYIKFEKGAFEVVYIDREDKITYADEDGFHEKNKSDYVGSLFSWSDEVEVIGNIYDNPELLEGN